MTKDIYRPQGKVMFSEVYVSHSVQGGWTSLEADPPSSGGSPRGIVPSGGHCSSRCASYWNEFLCGMFSN